MSADKVIVIRPQEPLVQTLKYKTDIISSRTGNEKRLLINEHPRQTWDCNLRLTSEGEIRKWKAELFRDTAEEFKLPLWHEAVGLTQDADPSDTVINGDFTLTEVAATDQVLLISGDEQTCELATVLSVAAGSITVTTGITNAYPVPSRVVPISLVQLPDGAQLRRYPNNAAELRLRLNSTTQAAQIGKGAAALTTLGGLNVLDRRPLNNDLVQETFRSNVEIIDFGNKFYSDNDYDEAKITRELRFLIDTPAERQYWKLFLDTVKGMREPFLVPTYRPDFVLSSQPAQGASTIVVDDPPDIATEYGSSLAHDWVFLQTDGVDHLSQITSYVDNGSTIDINMTTALNNDPDDSTINVVSHMEQSRLGSDVIRLEHFSTYSIIALSVTTVQA